MLKENANKDKISKRNACLMSKCEQSQKHGLHSGYLDLILGPGEDDISLKGPRGCFLSHVLLEALGVPSRARVRFLSHRNWRASGTAARNAILRQSCLLTAEATLQKAVQQLLEWISAHSPWEPATML